jgi:hypothetical protein
MELNLIKKEFFLSLLSLTTNLESLSQLRAPRIFLLPHPAPLYLFPPGSHLLCMPRTLEMFCPVLN